MQEGWDCPFAYILVSLNNVGSGLSMTQLVGRILRQPYQERTAFPELNESYVFCLHRRAGEIAREVKKVLEKEGYEGDAAGAVVDASDPDYRRPQRTVHIRDEFLSLYKKPYAGKIYLPHFCVKTGARYEALDYFRHLISRVDVEKFAYDKIDWPLADELKAAKDRFYTITLGEDLIRQSEKDVDALEADEQVLGWIGASLPFTYLSYKQLHYVVRRVYERLIGAELDLRDRLALVKFVVRDKIQAFMQDEIDAQTEAAFAELFNEGRLQFYLECGMPL